jgi:hypothetical protein
MHFKWLLFKSIDNLIGTQFFSIEIDNLIFLQLFFKNPTHRLHCDVATLEIKHKERLTMKVELY